MCTIPNGCFVHTANSFDVGVVVGTTIAVVTTIFSSLAIILCLLVLYFSLKSRRRKGAALGNVMSQCTLCTVLHVLPCAQYR